MGESTKMRIVKRFFPVLLGTLATIAAADANGSGPSKNIPVAGREIQSRHFNVRCDLSGAHGDDSDRLPSGKEIELLQAAIEDVYPQLPRELQEISKEIVFMISHREKGWTKLVMGWGPEDDADYRYPDTRFYPAGTIKVSFTEKTMAALALGAELSKSDPQMERSVKNFSHYIIAHELTHARQYHQAPIPDLLALHKLGSVADHCQEGLLDEALLMQAEKRLKYEKEAYAAHRSYIEKNGLLGFAAAIESYEATHRVEFSAGGKYHLLASEGPSPFVGKLREEASMVGHGGEFGPLAKFPNEGQVIPAEIVWTFKRLNDRLAGSVDSRSEAVKAVPQIDEIETQWDLFMTGANLERVEKFLPCRSRELGGRYRMELARFESFLLPEYAVTEK